MKKAVEGGIKVTIHAGELGPKEHVSQAINAYFAERIGHGYALANCEVEERHAEIRNGRIHLEICPTSSVCTGAVRLKRVNFEGDILDSVSWEDHPAKVFIDAGLSVSINTDDPSVFSCYLTDELILVHEKMGVSLEGMKKILLDTVRASWADEELKTSLHERISREFGRLMGTM